MAQAKNDDVCGSCRLLVTSKDPMDKEKLTIYLENVTCTENLDGAVELSSDQLRALVSLNSPVNLEKIKVRMQKKQNMKIQVAACPAADKVLIKNFSGNLCDEELTLYFEDERQCPSGGDVVSVKMYDGNVMAVIQFQHCCVAERVVKDAHPYLGSGVKISLWSPLDDVADLELVPSAHSTADTISATAGNSTQDPVIYYVKKPRDQTQLMESLPDTGRSHEDRSTNDSQKKLSISNVQAQTLVQGVSSHSTPQQMSSSLMSDAVDSHCKCLQIDANNEVQFYLLKQRLGSGFAREHRCTFTADEHSWTITLRSNNEQCIRVLAEQIYGYINSGTFEVEVRLSLELGQVLYNRHKQWLRDRLRSKVNEPAMLIMNSSGGLAVVALSQNTADEGAEKLRACLLRGKVPLTEHQHKVVTSAKFSKELKKIVTNKAIDMKTGAHEITVDGLPRDVVCAVSEIDQLLYKH